MYTPHHHGDPRHPRHGDFLHALGVAVYSAAGVAKITVDILRVHHKVEFFDLVDLTLGKLVQKLMEHAKSGSPVPGLREYADEVNRVKEKRNDLIHSLPVRDGLHRRTRDDLQRVVNFYSVEDLQAFTADFDAVRGHGNRLLYFDGGTAVKAYSA